jgi:HSP20 family molecular chaperone IbpA
MEYVTWSPLKTITRAEDRLSRLLGDDWWEIEMPATDMYEEDGNLVIEASLRNFKEEEIEVSSSDSELEITAQHEEKTQSKDRHYYLHETTGNYWRRVRFPRGIKVGQPAVRFADGLLKVTMPIQMYG